MGSIISGIASDGDVLVTSGHPLTSVLARIVNIPSDEEQLNREAGSIRR